VGFPGETQDTFECCMRTLEDLSLHYLHVFTYSVRAGTVAAGMGNQVRGPIASSRHQRISELGRQQAWCFAESQVGEPLVVLTEKRSDEMSVEGWSDNYLRVDISDQEGEIGVNEFVTARVSGVSSGRRVYGTAERDGYVRCRPA